MQFVNSYKMKFSVIIAVLHMLLGLAIRFINNIKEKKFVDMIFLTIPQTIFMLTTFFYMDYLIIFKWFHKY
jgi:V-type H+-transporting ATPase subunit a